MKKKKKTEEHKRLAASEARLADWKKWGPYLSERAWGTVREDYSPGGNAWTYFPHAHARSRVYRWNEDGIGGFCNRHQNICLAVAFWNGQDPILKERFFGVTGRQGNHGEDVKEYYFYLDGTPTHTYACMLYKYPQVAYPYDELVAENRRRSRSEPEYELIDAVRDTFQQHRYFDIYIEYAKADQEDLLCRISAVNRGPDAAPLHILPHVWFRNTWDWGYDRTKPRLRHAFRDDVACIEASDRHVGDRFWYAAADGHAIPQLLFTENETNQARLYEKENPTPFVKDSINDAVVQNEWWRVNGEGTGTKAAALFSRVLQPGEAFRVMVRFSPTPLETPFEEFDTVLVKRKDEADAFYDSIHTAGLSEDARRVQRQALAGLMWSKQFYHYSVALWLNGDPAGPPPPDRRKDGRNRDWEHLYNLDVVSMPDTWEYPWYAAWDLAFHTLPIAMIDPEWAKRQLILMLREWYMHPNGQIPAYEWAFDDVNPPVHAWACLRVYEMTRDASGKADTLFLERVFHKLLLNFTWWVNRKDVDGRNIFQGGFLGLDNIGVFDRSARLPTGGRLDQADATAWMAMYALNMLSISLELARTKPAYEDVATKFFEHFVYIAHAMNAGYGGSGLWSQEDGFFYDMLHGQDRTLIPLRIRSFVGLIPLYAVERLDQELLERLPRFRRRVDWFVRYRPHLLENVCLLMEPGHTGSCLLSLVGRDQLTRVLQRMLDEEQFLSDYGVRGLSKEHGTAPFTFDVDRARLTVAYEPAESTTDLFGGNSNWRGPVWFPVNYLMIESLREYYNYYGGSLTVDMPTGSGRRATLLEVADELSRRLTRLFLPDSAGRRPFHGQEVHFQTDPLWKDYVLFYEYFHGDTGAGLGASHQTGWTALVAKLLDELDEPHPHA